MATTIHAIMRIGIETIKDTDSAISYSEKKMQGLMMFGMNCSIMSLQKVIL
jgi:hypothetical protein